MAPRNEVRPTSPSRTRRNGSPRGRTVAQGARRPRRLLILGLASVACLGTALGLLARFDHRPERVARGSAGVPASAEKPEPAWTPVADKAPILMLAGARPELRLTSYRAREVVETGAREDWAVFGSFSDGPYLSVTLTRAQAAETASHFVEIARRASEAGLAIVRLGQPQALPARFAGLEASELRLSNGSLTRACLSFRARQADLGFALTGWSCEDGPPEAARERLACRLDRLTLTEANADLTLRIAFAQEAPRSDPGCPTMTEPSSPAVKIDAAPAQKRVPALGPRRPHVSAHTRVTASF